MNEDFEDYDDGFEDEPLEDAADDDADLMDEFEADVDDAGGPEDEMLIDEAATGNQDGFTWKDAAILGGAMGMAYEDGRMREKAQQRQQSKIRKKK